MILTAVYIAPDANARLALVHLYSNTSKQWYKHSDGVHVISGDFNHANYNLCYPIIFHVNSATRGRNTLAQLYCNLMKAYRVVPLPHLGLSDHLCLLVLFAYILYSRAAKPPIKPIT